MKLVKRTVEITQADIDKGKPTECRECPGALAVLRTFPELSSVAVYGGGMRYWRRGVEGSWTALAKGVFMECPCRLTQFVHQYDRSAIGRPTPGPCAFELELELP